MSSSPQNRWWPNSVRKLSLTASYRRSWPLENGGLANAAAAIAHMRDSSSPLLWPLELEPLLFAGGG